jgi:[acyl-carrier-protein] S-malonyltransferase
MSENAVEQKQMEYKTKEKDKPDEKLLMMFPGVGSQYIGMGKELYENSGAYRETLDEASDELKRDIRKLCLSPENKEELNRLQNAQTMLVVHSVAAYRKYMAEIGIEPAYAMGHSLGEYSALCCAGAIGFADVLRLVKRRGEIINRVAASLEGTMAWVINLERDVVQRICTDISREGNEVYISAVDTLTQTSISGHTETLMKAARELEKAGAIVYPLKMSGPFHCPLMEEAARQMEEELNAIDFSDMMFPVVANRNAVEYDGPAAVARNLARQLVSPVRWLDSVGFVTRHGVKTAVEIGPKNVLAFLMKKINPEIKTYTTDKEADYGIMKQELKPGEAEEINLLDTSAEAPQMEFGF